MKLQKNQKKPQKNQPKQEEEWKDVQVTTAGRWRGAPIAGRQGGQPCSRQPAQPPGGGLEGLQGQQSFQEGFKSTAGQGKSGMTGLKLSGVIGRGTKNPQHSRRPDGASNAAAALHIQGWLSCRYDSTADPLTGAGGLPGLSLGQLRVRPLEPA